MTIWLTGISGAGKTTIAQAFFNIVKPIVPELVMIDGDLIRELYGNSLGFNEDARREQIGRIQRFSKFLSAQNIPVIVTALYCHPDLMKWNRDNLKDYFEVYVDTPLSVVKERDVKGIYEKAKRGEMPNVVGIDIPWHPPESPDLVLETHNHLGPHDLANDLLKKLKVRFPRFWRGRQ